MLALCHLHDRGPSVTVSLRQAIEIHARVRAVHEKVAANEARMAAKEAADNFDGDQLGGMRAAC